jgi:hypothetical protein
MLLILSFFVEQGVGYSEKLEARLSTIGTERRNSLPKVSPIFRLCSPGFLNAINHIRV